MERRDERSPADRQDEARNDSQAQLTGATVLFSIILSFQFSVVFPRLTPFEKGTYYVALLAASVTLVLLLAPTVYSRFLGNRDPGAAVTASDWTVAVAILTFGLTIVATLALVTSRLLAGVFVAGFAGLIGLLIVALWLVVPLRFRRRD